MRKTHKERLHHGLYVTNKKDYEHTIKTVYCQIGCPKGGGYISRHIEPTKAKPGRDRKADHTSNEKID